MNLKSTLTSRPPYYLDGLNPIEAGLVETVVQGTLPEPANSPRLPVSLRRVLKALQAYAQGPAGPQEPESETPAALPNQAAPPVLRIQLDVVQGSTAVFMGSSVRAVGVRARSISHGGRFFELTGACL